MKAVMRNMWCDEIDTTLENYLPDDPDFFNLRISLRIGSDTEEGTNDFDLYVCTPSWIEAMLREEQKGAEWGRHMLIISSYDLGLITEKIITCIDSCTGKDFLEIAQKISRFAAWEFEDYQSA